MNQLQTIYLAGGCYWGMEELFRVIPGVINTQVGFSGGHIANVSYREVTTGTTGHAETLMIQFNSEQVSLRHLLFEFFRLHNPTKLNQQGNDIGTQYRSAIYTVGDNQAASAESVVASYGERLRAAGYGVITTELTSAGPFYLAEEYHQQYLIANPNGYCGLGSTGVACPVGLSTN